MRVITVRQPWAWAIMHGGKDVENRSRNIVGDYRGRVGIHAGLKIEPDAIDLVAELTGHSVSSLIGLMTVQPLGAILGTVEVTSVHQCRDCSNDEGDKCSEWAMRGHVHLTLADPQPFDEPILARGRLGLWNFDVRPLPRAVSA